MNRIALAKELLALSRELLRTSKHDLWDAFTERHFQQWLDHTIHDDEREEVENGIRKLVEDDPDLMSGSGHGWAELRNMAEKQR